MGLDKYLGGMSGKAADALRGRKERLRRQRVRAGIEKPKKSDKKWMDEEQKLK